MPNERMIRLRPIGPKSAEYSVFVGDSSKKLVETIYTERERTFTPFCFADFKHTTRKGFQIFTLDIGYKVSHRGAFMPGAQNQGSGHMISYRDENDFIVRVESGELIDQYRTLRLLSAMPEIKAITMGNMRDAADLVHAYDRSDLKPEAFLRSKYSIPGAVPLRHSEPKGLISRIQSGLKTLVAEPAVEVKKEEMKVKAPLAGIVAALESLPVDSNRRVIEPNTYVDLVVSRK